MQKSRIHTLGLVGLFLLVTAEAGAHGQATGIVLERHNSMTEIRDANKVIQNMVRGKAALDSNKVKASAAIISKHSETMLDLFPDTKASRHGKGSNAKQEIWSSFEEFSKWNAQMGEVAKELQEMADGISPEQLKAQHRRIGKTCAGCHKQFRRKKGH